MEELAFVFCWRGHRQPREIEISVFGSSHDSPTCGSCPTSLCFFAFYIFVFCSVQPKMAKGHKRAFGFPHQFEFPSQASQCVLMVKFCLETVQWEGVMVSFIPTHGSTLEEGLAGDPAHHPGTCHGFFFSCVLKKGSTPKSSNWKASGNSLLM